MGKTGLFLVSARLIFETMSFFNFKYLYRNFNVSASFIIYATHSCCGIFLLVDLLRHGKSILSTIERRTGIKKRKFLLSTLILSFFSNFRSLLKLSLFEHISDTAIVTLSCSSVLFTKLFFDRDKRTDNRRRCFIMIIVAGMTVIILGEKKYAGCLCILFTAFISSVYSVLYKNMIEKTTTLEDKIAQLEQHKQETMQSLENNRKIDTYLRSPLSCEDFSYCKIPGSLSVGGQVDLPTANPNDQESSSMAICENKNNMEGNYSLYSCHKNTNSICSCEFSIGGNESNTSFTVGKLAPRIKRIVLESPENFGNADRVRNFYITYYYMSFTGAITALFYWPLLFSGKCEYWNPKYLLLVFISMLLSSFLSFHYFVAIGLVSAVFAQVSGLLFKVIVLISQIAENGAKMQDFCALIVFLAIFYMN